MKNGRRFVKIVILAGGSGQRLWPLSRKTYPKQFLDFGDGETLLQKTVDRFEGREIFIATSAEYAHMVRSQIEGVRIIIEPQRKNTGPAIAFSIRELLQKGHIDESDCLLITPSDQFLSPHESLMKGVEYALQAARKGLLVTFGIKPTKPETGYGYIQVEATAEQVKKVVHFHEKPSRELAGQYLKDPEYYWNSGMFVFQVGTFLHELSLFAPELLGDFDQCPSISIDYALFEKSKRVALVPLDVVWSDVGSWDSLYEVLKKDEDQNVRAGNVHAVDTKRTLILAEKRLVTTIGVEDLAIVETEDAIFIGKRGETQRVKEIVESLASRGAKESQEHLTIHRPWGTYSILEEEAGFKIKKIVVRKGASLSLQKHTYRSEHWVVIKGRAKVTLGEQEMLLAPNQSVFVPKGVKHRLENEEDDSLEIIEVQVGGYLGEDDIERFDDVYGRAPETVSGK